MTQDRIRNIRQRIDKGTILTDTEVKSGMEVIERLNTDGIDIEEIRGLSSREDVKRHYKFYEKRPSCNNL